MRLKMKQQIVEDTEDDDDDNAFRGMSVSPPNTMESSDASDENDYPMM